MKIPNIDSFLARHQLPDTYKLDAVQWFSPLAENLSHIASQQKKTLVVGINGSQGSGKSTLADLLVFILSNQYGLNVVALSIDDFYYTRQEREQLSETVHPLMLTRGAPGSHDVALAINTIQSLRSNKTTLIPRFDKANDDRYPQNKWDRTTAKVDIILFEGWCVGATAQSDDKIKHAVNALEQDEDADGIWRRHVNLQLRDVYPELFGLIDTWIMLKAPSFDCVYHWRLEQEDKLRASLSATASNTNKIMDEQSIKRFIQHYQSVTEHLLETLPGKVDFLFELDENRKISKSGSG